MLRISQLTPPLGRARLVLEGRLVGPWVAELRGAATAATAAAGLGLGDLDLDVAGVTFADDDGVAALRDLRGAGVQLVQPSGFLAALMGVDDGAGRG